MIDAFGTEVNVGDTVVYIEPKLWELTDDYRTNHGLCKAKITKITSKSITITRELKNGETRDISRASKQFYKIPIAKRCSTCAYYGKFSGTCYNDSIEHLAEDGACDKWEPNNE
jgi:hypothetical protein